MSREDDHMIWKGFLSRLGGSLIITVSNQACFVTKGQWGLKY